tara:strand:+ start:393 stop:578 length:186 start_codon:yes stop_codon:yes gene_type:complete
MIKDWIKEIPNWESQYLDMVNDDLTERQKKLLKGDPIKSHEGMIYGRMYRDWKDRKEINWI